MPHLKIKLEFTEEFSSLEIIISAKLRVALKSTLGSLNYILYYTIRKILTSREERLKI